LAEMIVGKPVFPGTSTLDQLERVIEITGRPS
jgi:mitogen-activated protein kinase 15